MFFSCTFLWLVRSRLFTGFYQIWLRLSFQYFQGSDLIRLNAITSNYGSKYFLHFLSHFTFISFAIKAREQRVTKHQRIRRRKKSKNQFSSVFTEYEQAQYDALPCPTLPSCNAATCYCQCYTSFMLDW